MGFDGCGSRVHADGVDAVRLGCEVTAELGLHARGHVRVVHVADEQSDAQRGDDARVHDLLGLANLASSATNDVCAAARDKGLPEGALGTNLGALRLPERTLHLADGRRETTRRLG